MPPEIGKLAPYWTTAKKAYTSRAKYKKPADKTLFWRHSTGIEAALKQADKTHKGAWTTQKKYDAYNAAQLKLFAASQTYSKKLEDIIKAAQKNQGVPAGLTAAAYEAAVGELRDSLTDVTNVARKYTVQCLTALNMAKSLAATIQRGLDFAAKVKQTPTPAKFNYTIQKAARDITQQIANIDNLKGLGMDTGFRTPQNLVDVLVAWGGQGRKVPVNATAKEVLRENGAFEQAVLGVKKWLDAGGK
jgi:hypothetical protein